MSGDTEKTPCLHCQVLTSVADGGNRAHPARALPLVCPKCWADYQQHLAIVRSHATDPRRAQPI